MALLFPGQGSQRVGMAGDLADRSRFEEASQILGFDLWQLCLEGPSDSLEQTEHAQPAIFVTSYCYFEMAQSLIRPVSAAGHSLGEYSALAAAGALSFADAVSLVKERSTAMAEAGTAHPGGMAAVLGLTWPEVAEMCEKRRADGGEIWPANQNAPGQSVVAGSLADIDWIVDHAKEFGAKRAIRLGVSGAFHSPYMQPAAEQLAAALDDVAISEPNFPVWANATGDRHGGADEIRSALVDQLTAPVRWIDCLEGLAGAEAFCCFGPGDSASGLVKRTIEGAKLVRAETADRIREIA